MKFRSTFIKGTTHDNKKDFWALYRMCTRQNLNKRLAKKVSVTDDQ